MLIINRIFQISRISLVLISLIAIFVFVEVLLSLYIGKYYYVLFMDVRTIKKNYKNNKTKPRKRLS